MNKICIFISIASIIFLSGCIPNANEVSDPKIASEYSNVFLPYNAKNLRSLGNQWVLFDLELNGKTRTYMYQAYSTNGYHTGSIVEIK